MNNWKRKVIEAIIQAIIAALTALLTAVTASSCSPVVAESVAKFMHTSPLLAIL